MNQEYLVRLSLQAGIGPVLIKHIITQCAEKNVWDELLTCSSHQLVRLLSVTVAQAALIYTALHDEYAWQKHQQWLEKSNARIVTIDDSDYPSLLASIHVPPPVLWMRGAALPKQYTACAFVGARRVTRYAQRIIASLLPSIVEQGIITVSGGARGVDGAIHEHTLRAKGHTVMVAGCGLQHCYPSEHAPLFDEIINNSGTIVSCFAPWIGPSRGTFPARNRIIAGVAQSCVVVQAAQRSGALITADYAMQEGRDVGVIPGPIDDEAFVGSNKLLLQGAAPIVDISALADFCHVSIRPLAALKKRYSEEQQAVLDALESPATFDDLVAAGHTDQSRLQALLYELQTLGTITQNHAGFWERCE